MQKASKPTSNHGGSMPPSPQLSHEKPVHQDLTFESLEIPKKEEKVRMALYISPLIAREFKKLAIDEDTDSSKLAELVFETFLKSRGRVS